MLAWGCSVLQHVSEGLESTTGETTLPEHTSRGAASVKPTSAPTTPVTPGAGSTQRTHDTSPGLSEAEIHESWKYAGLPALRVVPKGQFIAVTGLVISAHTARRESAQSQLFPQELKGGLKRAAGAETVPEIDAPRTALSLVVPPLLARTAVHAVMADQVSE